MRRCGGSSSPDGAYRYVLVYNTFARSRVFVAREPVALVSAQFLRAASEERFEILTYCFMPDHVHLLVEAVGDACDGTVFMSRSKQLSAFRYGARFGQRLWQRDSFERPLRDTQDALTEARYILANPVRTGIVTHPLDYPYSGSFAWDKLGGNLYLMNSISL